MPGAACRCSAGRTPEAYLRHLQEFAHQESDNCSTDASAEEDTVVQGNGACAAPVGGTLCFLEWAWSGGAEPQAIEARHVECAVSVVEGLPVAARAGRSASGKDSPTSMATPAPVLRWLHTATRRRCRARKCAAARRMATAARRRHEVQALLEMLVRAGWLREAPVKGLGTGSARREVGRQPRVFFDVASLMAEIPEWPQIRSEKSNLPRPFRYFRRGGWVFRKTAPAGCRANTRWRDDRTTHAYPGRAIAQASNPLPTCRI